MAPRAEATFPGRNGRIAIYGSWLRCVEQGRIATIKPDGKGFRAVTDCGEWFSSPQWFADGRRLLVSRGGMLAVMAADGSHARSVPLHVDNPVGISAASIAPDGRRFAYVRPIAPPWPPEPGSPTDVYPEIWRAAIDGTHNRKLGEGFSPRWSPDGRRIAFVGADGLSVMDAETGKHVRVLVGGFSGSGSLDWSPDSRRLLYSALCCGSGLYSIRADGTGQSRQLIPGPTSPHEQVFSAVWSPNGKRIAFARAHYSGESVIYSIWTATVRGTRLTRIHSSGLLDAEENTAPEFSWGAQPQR